MQIIQNYLLNNEKVPNLHILTLTKVCKLFGPLRLLKPISHLCLSTSRNILIHKLYYALIPELHPLHYKENETNYFHSNLPSKRYI